MKSGLFVVGLCLLVSGFFAYGLKRQLQTDLVRSQDLMLGLIYFMERHEGRLPASEQEFLAMSFVEKLPEGAIRIKPPEQTEYRPETHGITIEDLARFKVAWGQPLDDLELNEYGRVIDPDGKKVQLVEWPGSPPSGKGYSVVLLKTSREIQGKLKAAPAPVVEAAQAAD